MNKKTILDIYQNQISMGQFFIGLQEQCYGINQHPNTDCSMRIYMKSYLNKKNILFFLKLPLLVFLFWLLVHTLQFKFDLLFRIFNEPFYLCVSVILFCLMAVINAWRWYKLLNAQNIRIRYWKSIFPTYLGIGFNNILPGSIGGDAVRAWYVMKHFKNEKTSIILSVIIDRLIGLLSLFFIISMILLTHSKILKDNPVLNTIVNASLTILVSAFSIFLIFMLSLNKVNLKRYVINVLPDKFHHFIKQILQSVLVYRHSKLVMAESLLSAVTSQFLLAFILMLMMKMMGLDVVSLLDIAIALGIAQIVNLLPLTPGGLGAGEIAFANVLLLLDPRIGNGYATIFFTFRILFAIVFFPGVLAAIVNFDLINQKNILIEPEQAEST